MIIDISVATIAGAFVFLVVFLIVAIVKLGKTAKEINAVLRSAKKELDELNADGGKLIRHLNEISLDAKRKLSALDCFFKPLEEKNHEPSVVSELAECVGAALQLYRKIKKGIKEYVKP